MNSRTRRNPTRFPRRLATAVGASCTAVWLACAPAAEEGGEATAADTAGPMATAAGVETAFAAFTDAWEAQDLEAVVATFTADAVMFDPVPPGKFAGSQGIRGLVSGAFEAAERISIPVSEIEVQTHGPVAWSTARYTYQMEAAGETTSEEGYVSMVWVLQDDGSYRATLFHASPLPEAPQGDAP